MKQGMTLLPLRYPAKLVGTWFGSGLSPKAPGTMGTLAALPFAYVIQAISGCNGLLLASLLISLIGWYATHIYLRHTDAKDPKEIVVDEVAGIWLLLGCMEPVWQSYALGFVMFRFFDVLKPWPVSWADRKIGGALGVMMDDILAGIYPLVLAAGYWVLTSNYVPYFRVF
jgi:phosphatidylglycerophosphatase A